MRATVDLLDAAFGTLDGQTSVNAAPDPSVAATIGLYALQRMFHGAVAESAGNGRVEFLFRLAKFGVRSFEQTPQALAPRAPAIFS